MMLSKFEPLFVSDSAKDAVMIKKLKQSEALNQKFGIGNQGMVRFFLL